MLRVGREVDVCCFPSLWVLPLCSGVLGLEIGRDALTLSGKNLYLRGVEVGEDGATMRAE